MLNRGAMHRHSASSIDSAPKKRVSEQGMSLFQHKHQGLADLDQWHTLCNSHTILFSNGIN